MKQVELHKRKPQVRLPENTRVHAQRTNHLHDSDNKHFQLNFGVVGSG